MTHPPDDTGGQIRARRPARSQVLTFEEIKARFPSEWVIIGEAQTDEALEVVAGEVLFHSDDRDEVDRKLLELRPRRFALRYLGTLPDNMAIVL